MKNFTFKINIATRKIHHTPTSGARLISLDCNYTKQYNYSNDEFYGFHHCSFKGIDFRHKGGDLVASTCSCEAESRSKNTLQNYIQKFKKSVFASILFLPFQKLKLRIKQ